MIMSLPPKLDCTRTPIQNRSPECSRARRIEREDVRDALVSRNGECLAELRGGARVGTSSLRRQAQLLHLRPDLELVEIRGNVDTRLKKLAAEGLDAVALAAAGLKRLGWEGRISELLPADR